jgi:SAM-dependent methyltransferase
MSTQNRSVHVDQKIIDFYTRHLIQFGNSSKGVGWKDEHAQVVRFAQLARVFYGKQKFLVNDLGCGAGHFFDYLRSEKYTSITYHGYDILEEMIQLAKNNLSPNSKVILTKIQSADEMIVADYTVASGIFNVKYDINEKDWLDHILTTLQSVNSCSKQGFAFNLLTKYSDPEYMQPYLYYADPLLLFDFCKRNFSKEVALLHDYFMYDFTILVRKHPANYL